MPSNKEEIKRESNKNKVPNKSDDLKQREQIEREIFKRDFEDRKKHEKD